MASQSPSRASLSETTTQTPAAVWKEDTVLELYMAQRRDAWTYRMLGAQTSGASRQTLFGISAKKSQQAQRLAAVYFVMTGVRACAKIPKPEMPRTYLEGLRQAYRQEQCAAAKYRRDAQQMPEHAEWLTALADCAECAAKKVFCLLQTCLSSRR